MELEIHTPPRTIMEVYNMLPENTLAELINGQIFMSPAPNNQHQRILKRIARVLDDFVMEKELGEIFISPSDVYFDATSNAVQPDIYFVSNKNEMIVSDTEPNRGVPDLIVEILSPSNDRHDTLTKKKLYEKFKVSEYWIVDPSSKEVRVYELQNDSFHLIGKAINKAYSSLLDYHFTF